MSQATPMSTARRIDIYGGDWDSLTDRQYRQVQRMDNRQHFRRVGLLPASGATGARTRRPIPRPGLTPERGSIVTHVAALCPPCAAHGRPRLHRTERVDRDR